MVDLRAISPIGKILIVLSLSVIIIALVVSSQPEVDGKTSTERETYVHNYINSGTLGNWTFMEKPLFPVLFDDSQILVGHNWSIICPLQANRSYHAYFYGEWIDLKSSPKTDYDIYVYNYLGELEGYHTEAAGLPEHLGSSVNEAFFLPKYTGNYTFVIVNDIKESSGAQKATFMIIEDVECNVWQEHYVEGKSNSDTPTLNTSWAYEFTTESQFAEVYVKVPETLDMYEARLYLMSDSSIQNRTVLNSVPLAWEPGLYGNRSSDQEGASEVGGYNLDSQDYRGVTFASCELHGQDMLMNFTSPVPGRNLYHLVLIGEEGSGTASFLIKTEFNSAFLIPSEVPERISPGNNAAVVYTSHSSNLENAAMRYSTDDWKTVNTTTMQILENRTCKGVIPAQVAGTAVNYSVTVHDSLKNVLTANGSYSVKYLSAINFSSPEMEARPGENLTITGYLSPQVQGAAIAIYITSANDTKELTCLTQENGTFSADFKPETVGTWIAHAEFNGSTSVYESASSLLTIRVEEPLATKYSFYILGGIGGGIAAGLAILLKKSKG